MEQVTLLMIIAGASSLIAIVMILNLLQKAGINVYAKIKQMLNPNYKAHKNELKRQKGEAKAKVLAEKYKQK